MIANKRSDQVFQLSLTEIAFTISFILLLLLGYLVSREHDGKRRAEEALTKVQELELAKQAFDDASKILKEALHAAGSVSPQDVISKLVAEVQQSVERDRLLVRVKDLEMQISALSEVKQIAADASKGAGRSAVVDRVVSALAMQSEAEEVIRASRQQGTVSKLPSPEETRAEVRRSIEVMAAIDQVLKEVGAKPLPTGKESSAVASMVSTAQSMRGHDGAGKGIEFVLKENADLRGQMANMRNRYSVLGRGLDHPPCWADEAGNIEYLFKVELRSDLITVTPAWPERRRIDAEKLPGVLELIAAPLNPERFRISSRPILEISKRQDPECRHFVILINTIETRREADQARWMVENFFYKREAGR